MSPRDSECEDGVSPDTAGTAKDVPAAYDRIAEAWRASRTPEARGDFPGRRFADRLTAPLPPASRVLDVGCGCGMPIAAYLVRHGFQVTGLDASARMIALAREAVPAAHFVHGDMRTADLEEVFDGLVAWDSVFHLPRTEHGAVFARFRAWLRPGGRLLVSLGGSAEEGFTSAMFGETFYYSGHEPGTALRQLQQAGFRIEHWEIDDPASRGHMAVLAVTQPAP